LTSANNPNTYDEPEGIFPDGNYTYTLVECSRHNTSNSGGHIDLWKLKLDLNDPTWERLTWFNETGIYKASNPVVSDDGTRIAFQIAGSKEVAGIGHGIYILDLTERQ
jgi:Tol biopolymer transport system component